MILFYLVGCRKGATASRSTLPVVDLELDEKGCRRGHDVELRTEMG